MRTFWSCALVISGTSVVELFTLVVPLLLLNMADDEEEASTLAVDRPAAASVDVRPRSLRSKLNC